MPSSCLTCRKECKISMFQRFTQQSCRIKLATIVQVERASTRIHVILKGVTGEMYPACFLHVFKYRFSCRIPIVETYERNAACFSLTLDLIKLCTGTR